MMIQMTDDIVGKELYVKAKRKAEDMQKTMDVESIKYIVRYTNKKTRRRRRRKNCMDKIADNNVARLVHGAHIFEGQRLKMCDFSTFL